MSFCCAACIIFVCFCFFCRLRLVAYALFCTLRAPAASHGPAPTRIARAPRLIEIAIQRTGFDTLSECLPPLDKLFHVASCCLACCPPFERARVDRARAHTPRPPPTPTPTTHTDTRPLYPPSQPPPTQIQPPTHHQQTMRVLAFFALLGSAAAFMPAAPVARANSRLVIRMSGEYSEKVRP